MSDIILGRLFHKNEFDASVFNEFLEIRNDNHLYLYPFSDIKSGKYVIGVYVLHNFICPQGMNLDQYRFGKNGMFYGPQKELEEYQDLSLSEVLTSIPLRRSILKLALSMLPRASINDFAPHWI